MSAAGHESFYGLVERPFSLTPDPKYFFKSRSHGRALEALTFGLRRRDRFLLATGDLGVGKTTICRTLAEQWKRRAPVVYVANPLLAPRDLLRLLLEDVGAISDEQMRVLPAEASNEELFDSFLAFLNGLNGVKPGALLIVDEAHNTPMAIVEMLTRLSAVALDGERVLQIVMAAQPADGDMAPGGTRSIDSEIATRVRLLPFGRDDCAAYVAHRLTIAGGARVTFTPRAIDALFSLSGGLPRLVNLLCERALQEGAAHGMRKIEPAAIDAAASALELLRARPKRFRWFHRRVS
jgi:general secretion pathway protein A